MSDPQDNAFTHATKLLVQHTKLTGPQARGAVRLAFKEVGLDPSQSTPLEIAAVFRKSMPKKLEAQGIQAAEAARVCAVVAEILSKLKPERETTAAASDMFNRLDGAMGTPKPS